ncbi:MAG: tetratricopeptide repeat protein [Treponema sp.]
MSDLYKYLIGTLVGVLLCLLCFVGYYTLIGSPTSGGVPAIRPPANALQTAQSADFPDASSSDQLAKPNGDGLTAEEQARIYAAQAANEGLSKKYEENDDSSMRAALAARADVLRQDNPYSIDNTHESSTEDNISSLVNIDGQINTDPLLATAPSNSSEKNKQAAETVRDLIRRGKNALDKNVLPNSLDLFEQADAEMPDENAFSAESYRDIAHSLFLFSKITGSNEDAQQSRDAAETYIKKSLAAQNTELGRTLYGRIIEAQKNADALARQQALLAQQKAAEQEAAEKKAETQKRQIRDWIAQGKNAVQRDQAANALFSFDQADKDMPDSPQFASSAYTEMAESLLNLSEKASPSGNRTLVLNKAAEYAEKALDLTETPATRSLHAAIAAASAEARKNTDSKTATESEKIAQAQAETQKKQLEQARSAADAKKQAEARAAAEWKQKELLAKQQADAQKKNLERDRTAANTKQQTEARAEQERKAGTPLAKQQADAQKKNLEQDRTAANAKKQAEARAELERKAGTPLAKQQADAQKKNLEQDRTAANAKKQAEARAELERKAGTPLAKQQADAQKKPASQPQNDQKIRQEVRKFVTEGKQAAQRKQLSNAISAFAKADNTMPKDAGFAANTYREIADSLFALSRSAPNPATAQEARTKAAEYIQKSLDAKNTAEGRNLQARIADAQKKADAQSVAKQKQQNQQGKQGTEKAQAGNARADAAGTPRTDTPQQKTEVANLVAQGAAAADKGQFAEARTAFEKAARMMPQNDQNFAAGQYRKMADSLLKISRSAPNQADAVLKTGEEYIRKAITAKNADAESHFIYSSIADGLKNSQLALKELETAQRLDKTNAVYNYELGRKYFEQKKYQNARSSFEAAVKADPKYAVAFFNLGMTHKVLNAHKPALAAFGKAAALKPDYARACLELARMHDKTKQYKEAVAQYKKTLSIEPGHTAALKEMAQVYAKMKDNKQAVHYFQEALAAGDTDPVTYYNLATVQLDTGHIQDAVKNAEKAVAGSNRDARFLYTYALALEQNKNLGEAEKMYLQAISADSKYIKPKINLGRKYLETGKLKEAEEHLKAAYELEASNFEVNTNLGKLYGLKNQYGQSIEYYSKAIKLMPKDIEARQNLAAAYLSAGLKENARDTYKAIVGLDKQAWDSYYELGKVYISLNSSADAKAILEKLLQQKPNYRYAAEVKKLLASL